MDSALRHDPHRRSGISCGFGVMETRTTLVASMVALIGVTIMVGGPGADGHLCGDVAAFGMTLCMAIMKLIIRRHHETSMLLRRACRRCCVHCWSRHCAAARSTPFLFGTTQFGLGLVFLTVGDYFVSATENALINTLETPPAVA
jgi:drug/metabolite transporter (DMT)-like permease